MAEKVKTDKVDLNTANRDDLVAIPGIGDAGASAIVRYREEHGRFRSVDDLVNVPGIGAATLETAKTHLTASGGKGGDGGVGAKRASEKPAEMAKQAAEAGPEVLQRAGESAAEGVSRAARQTAAAAPEVAATAAELAQRTGAAAGGREQLLTPGREEMEDMARAGQIVLDRTSELGRVWVSFWSEQLTEGMEAMRALAACRTWHEALEVQSEFTRASFERAWSRATQSAELTADMMAGGLRLPPGVHAGQSRIR